MSSTTGTLLRNAWTLLLASLILDGILLCLPEAQAYLTEKISLSFAKDLYLLWLGASYLVALTPVILFSETYRSLLLRNKQKLFILVCALLCIELVSTSLKQTDNQLIFSTGALFLFLLLLGSKIATILMASKTQSLGIAKEQREQTLLVGIIITRVCFGLCTYGLLTGALHGYQIPISLSLATMLIALYHEAIYQIKKS